MIFIALGGNLHGPAGRSPLENCVAALERTKHIPGIRLCNCSSWYLSDPVPPSGQPPYCNGVASFEGDIEPEALLVALQEIEADGGRVRSIPNAARTIDLDIIAMGSTVRRTADPILPHPRAHERGFVLVPLAEIAPDWMHPLLGQSVCELIAGLPAQELRKLR